MTAGELIAVPGKSPWQQISTRRIYRNEWLTLTKDQVIRPDGSIGEYTYVESSSPYVLMVLRDQSGRLLLIRQFRYVLGMPFWEFAAGNMEPGESTIMAANRETGQEAGLIVGRWTQLGELYESVSTSDLHGTVLLGENLTMAPELIVDDEGIFDRRWVTGDEIRQMIRNGELKDSKTLAALAML